MSIDTWVADVQVRNQLDEEMNIYLEAVDAYAPNERCEEGCGFEIEQYHPMACQGHQFCLPECPQCGGRLVPIIEGRNDG